MRLSLIILLLATSAHAQVRYHFGDDPEWADPRFDDSSWPLASADKLPIPPSSSDGMVWLRFRVPVPADASSLAVHMTRTTGACTPGEVWVNGVHVGTQGRFPPSPAYDARCASSVFRLPNGVAPNGQTAVVAWRGWFPPIFRTPLPYGPPQPFEFEIGSPQLLRANEQLAADRARMALDLETFINLMEVLLGLGLFVLWWRTRASLTLLWFSLFILTWTSCSLFNDTPEVWQPDWSYTRYWAGVVYLSIPLSVASALFLRTAVNAPRWTIRGLVVIGILWPMLWFPPVLAVAPSLLMDSFGTLGLALFGVQQVGGVLIALWAAIRGGSETRALAMTFVLANAVSLLVDILMVWPQYVLWRGNRLFTDNLTALSEIVVMCYLLVGRTLREWRKKEELDAEFEAAREMQERLVPHAITVPGFHIESAYHPARHVGGDFFRILPGANGSVLVVVGDVSGKGLSAAMTVAAIAGALDNEFSRDPAEVLTHLNRALLARKSGGFVTCCAVRAELSGDATIANAGHLVPYSGGVELTVDAELPLGITEDAVYRETRIKLAPDQILTFVSDGVVEAATLTGELFGFERTRAISGDTPENIARAAREFGQNDDITVVTVRRQS